MIVKVIELGEVVLGWRFGRNFEDSGELFCPAFPPSSGRDRVAQEGPRAKIPQLKELGELCLRAFIPFCSECIARP